MQSENGVFARRESQALDGVELLRTLAMRNEGVDHDVADKMNLVCRNAFAEKIIFSGGFRRKEPFRYRVRENSVDLFGHLTVPRTKSGLDVCNRDVELHGSKCRGNRRIDIPHDEHDVRLPFDQQVFDLHEDLSRLVAVGP